MSAARPTGADMAAMFRTIPADELPAVIEILTNYEQTLRHFLARTLATSIIAIAEAISAGTELAGVIADFDEVAAALAGSKEDRLAADNVAYAEWFLAEIARLDGDGG